MKLFIAEKPELARAIANGLPGNAQSCDGYIQKGDNIITWAFGHVLGLAMPEDYNPAWQKWEISDLPLQIDKFKYKPIESSKKQLKIIQNWINSKEISSIVHCGDADDEGQILIDEILEFSNNTKPVERLLINDLTPKGIATALKAITSNDNFKGLSERGFARSLADWIVGINLTRAYTKKAQNAGYQGVLSVGRVQTPILGLVVTRDEAHDNFKAASYFSFSGKFNADGIEFRATLKTDERIEDENVAKNIVNACSNKNGVISLAKTEKKKETPPLPYNLLVLQSECAKKLGLKPDKVLEITQNLREKHHLITYNRSDCQYLPDTIFDQSPNILKSLKTSFVNDKDISSMLLKSNSSIKSSAFNTANISAHHGIIPTQTSADLSKLDKNELEIFTMISKRFIAQFFESREYDSTSIEIEIEGNKFVASQNKTTKLGFSEFFGKELDDEEVGDENESVDLAKISQGSSALCSEVKSEAKKTKPKPYYTMATLLNDLTGVAKYAKDPKIKALLQEKDKDKKGENGGIGTPATRTQHIKNLIEKEYISVSNDKKQIINATKKGKDLIAFTPSILSSPDMTALWFEKQKSIEKGELSRDEFLKEITEQVKSEIDNLKNGNLKSFIADENSIPCPTCKTGILLRKKSQKGSYFWGCSRWNDKSNPCKAMFSDEKGKPNFTSTSQNKNTTNDLCPVCKKNNLVERMSKAGKPYYTCAGWKSDGSGCNATFYKDFKTNEYKEFSKK